MALLKALRGDSSRISTSNTPFHDGYAYLTTDDGGFYIDATTVKGNERIRVNPKAKGRTITLPVSGWSGNAQTVSVPGVLADQTKQSVKLALADRTSMSAWAAGERLVRNSYCRQFSDLQLHVSSFGQYHPVPGAAGGGICCLILLLAEG